MQFKAFVALNNLSAGDFVMYDRVYQDNMGIKKGVIDIANQYVGYVKYNVAAGTLIAFDVLGGINTNLSGLIPGTIYYADPSVPGGITSTLPTGTPIIQLLGKATSPTSLDTGYWKLLQGSFSSGPTGPAGGDLSGTYPNPSVVWANGLPTFNSQYYPLSSNPAGYIDATSLLPYLTIVSAAVTYYPLTNPAGYITSAALSGYLTTASAAATYYPLTNPSGYISSITALDVTTALGYTPEDVANKSNDTTLGGITPSATLYPTQNAVKTYVDAAVASASSPATKLFNYYNFI